LFGLSALLARVHACICIQHVHVYMHACIYTSMYIYKYVCKQVCICTSMHTYKYACIKACTHTYIHVYMLTCIHTYRYTCMRAYLSLSLPPSLSLSLSPSLSPSLPLSLSLSPGTARSADNTGHTSTQTAGSNQTRAPTAECRTCAPQSTGGPQCISEQSTFRYCAHCYHECRSRAPELLAGCSRRGCRGPVTCLRFRV